MCYELSSGYLFKISNHNIRKFAKGEAVEGGRFLSDLNGSVPHGRGQAPFISEPDRTFGENEAKSLTPSVAGTCWNPLGVMASIEMSFVIFQLAQILDRYLFLFLFLFLFFYPDMSLI